MLPFREASASGECGSACGEEAERKYGRCRGRCAHSAEPDCLPARPMPGCRHTKTFSPDRVLKVLRAVRETRREFAPLVDIEDALQQQLSRFLTCTPTAAADTSLDEKFAFTARKVARSAAPTSASANSRPVVDSLSALCNGVSFNRRFQLPRSASEGVAQTPLASGSRGAANVLAGNNPGNLEGGVSSASRETAIARMELVADTWVLRPQRRHPRASRHGQYSLKPRVPRLPQRTTRSRSAECTRVAREADAAVQTEAEDIRQAAAGCDLAAHQNDVVMDSKLCDEPERPPRSCGSGGNSREGRASTAVGDYRSTEGHSTTQVTQSATLANLHLAASTRPTGTGRSVSRDRQDSELPESVSAEHLKLREVRRTSASRPESYLTNGGSLTTERSARRTAARDRGERDHQTHARTHARAEDSSNLERRPQSNTRSLEALHILDRLSRTMEREYSALRRSLDAQVPPRTASSPSMRSKRASRRVSLSDGTRSRLEGTKGNSRGWSSAPSRFSQNRCDICGAENRAVPSGQTGRHRRTHSHHRHETTLSPRRLKSHRQRVQPRERARRQCGACGDVTHRSKRPSDNAAGAAVRPPVLRTSRQVEKLDKRLLEQRPAEDRPEGGCREHHGEAGRGASERRESIDATDVLSPRSDVIGHGDASRALHDVYSAFTASDLHDAFDLQPGRATLAQSMDSLSLGSLAALEAEVESQHARLVQLGLLPSKAT